VLEGQEVLLLVVAQQQEALLLSVELEERLEVRQQMVVAAVAVHLDGMLYYHILVRHFRLYYTESTTTTSFIRLN
jgi:hypothetical protein